MLRISVLTVTENWVLRANIKNQRFARNRGSPFTGISQKSPICP
ncbi:MAG: vitamin B12-binding protein [Ligilactobacillus ruminis]|nr:vitamin B12-binding protein [Ligilactobacillus ruminis]